MKNKNMKNKFFKKIILVVLLISQLKSDDFFNGKNYSIKKDYSTKADKSISSNGFVFSYEEFQNNDEEYENRILSRKFLKSNLCDRFYDRQGVFSYFGDFADFEDIEKMLFNFNELFYL